MRTAIKIIDTDLDEILKRPGMFVGTGSPFGLESLVFHLLGLRCTFADSDGFRRVLDEMQVEHFGGRNPLGPASRLIDKLEVPRDKLDYVLSKDHEWYEPFMAFYRELVDRVRAWEAPSKGTNFGEVQSSTGANAHLEGCCCIDCCHETARDNVIACEDRSGAIDKRYTVAGFDSGWVACERFFRKMLTERVTQRQASYRIVDKLREILDVKADYRGAPSSAKNTP